MKYLVLKRESFGVSKRRYSKRGKYEISRKSRKKDFGIRSFFNMINYTIMVQVMLVVTILMAVFNKKEIANRNNISPLSIQDLQLNLHWDI